MIHSLRFRLLVMVAAVLAIALGAVALLSSRVVSVELHQSLGREERPLDLDALGAALTADHLRRGTWAGAHGILGPAGKRLQRELLLVGPGGRFVAATSPAGTYGRVRVQEGGRRLQVERRSAQGTAELRLVDPYRRALASPEGAPLGTLIAMPPSPAAQPGPAALLGRVNRALLLAALAAGSAGLLLSFALARRILRPVEALTAAARRMEAGDLDSRVAVGGRDEIGGLGRAFNAMAERRATAERLRRDLVGDVAHELRSPLTNLRCQIEGLQDGLVRPTPEALGSLAEEVELLEKLIDDLQDLALAEAGQLDLERGPLDLAGEVERAVKALRPRLEEADLRIEVDLPSGLPPVDADARRLGQILRNLLGNAITHTPPGGTIRVRGRAAGGEVAVTVEDTGPGIPPEHLPFLFERFYRTDVSRSRATGGAGLGLAIVKQLAAAHGGRVWVESEVGRGSVFGFSLPAV
ncbi:MAG TPA: ATP-binding protein [Thermoanaerobaculia bacterium]|nr:ATP-binding protein [Thermoanaerobaculia bacterium]